MLFSQTYNHRVASTPELVTKKYQVNEEDNDVDGRYLLNLALLRCIRNRNKFPCILNLFLSEILVQKFWKSSVNCHFHTEMRRLVPRKYTAASQICGFVIAKDMTIFNSVVQINPPFISAYAVSVVFYQTIIRLDKTSQNDRGLEYCNLLHYVKYRTATC